MSLPSPADQTPPDRAGRLAAILSIQPDDFHPLTQFSAEQRATYEWAIKWLHDFNLGRRPKPEFSDEVLCRLVEAPSVFDTPHSAEGGPPQRLPGARPRKRRVKGNLHLRRLRLYFP